MQITGRRNHYALGVKLNSPQKFIKNPELLTTYEWGVWAACEFWVERGLLDISNMPDNRKIAIKVKTKAGPMVINVSPVEYISRRVNGGTNGLDERIKFYERAKTVFV
jgi:putative chitinase